jgi:hypothetical protein
MQISPFLPTWLWGHGALVVLVAGWALLAGAAAWRGRWRLGGLLAVGSVLVWLGLWTQLGPLLLGTTIGDSEAGVQLAAAAPFVVLAGVGLVGAQRQRGVEGFDLGSMAPLAVVAQGMAAWVFGLVLLGQGWTAPGKARRALTAGLVLLGLAGAVGGPMRTLLADTAQNDLHMGRDAASQLVHGLSSGVELAGWAALSHWAWRHAGGGRGELGRQPARPSARPGRVAAWKMCDGSGDGGASPGAEAGRSSGSSLS